MPASSLNAFLSRNPLAEAGGRDFALTVYTARDPLCWTLPSVPWLRCIGVPAGQVAVRLGPAAPITASPERLALLPVGWAATLQGLDTDAARPVTCVVLDLPSGAVQRVAARLGSSSPDLLAGQEVPVSVLLPPALQLVVRTLAALPSSRAAPRALLIDLAAAQVAAYLLSTVGGPLRANAVGAPLPCGIAAAAAHVRRHLSRPLSVDDLADVACMSRSTFYRRFHAAMGMTPLQYITQQRVVRARALLSDPDRTVTAVSYDLGFRSVSHFIGVFRRHVGVTPRVYQEARSELQGLGS